MHIERIAVMRLPAPVAELFTDDVETIEITRLMALSNAIGSITRNAMPIQ